MVDQHSWKRRMRSRVRFPMTDQSRLLRERLAADVANVRPHASVNQQVLLQRCSTRERLVAYGAGVRFVTGVNPHVHL